MAIKVSKKFRWKTVNEKLKDNYFLFILKFEYSLIVYDIIISTSIVQSTLVNLNVKQPFSNYFPKFELRVGGFILPCSTPCYMVVCYVLRILIV